MLPPWSRSTSEIRPERSGVNPMNGNRHKTQTMAEGANDADEEMVTEFVGAVETCLERREELQPVLTDIRQEHLQGGSVQDRVDELCEAEPALLRIGLTAKMGQVPELLSVAEASGRLSEADADAFEAFWDRNDWIAEGVYTYFLGEKHDCIFWTNGDVDVECRNGDHYVRHRFDWGLDEAHDIEAPLPKAWDDLVKRLHVLATLHKLGRIDPNEDEHEALQESASKLQQVLEAIEVDPAEGNDGDGDSSDETPGLEKLFEGATSDDDGDGEENEEAADESLIGFQ